MEGSTKFKLKCWKCYLKKLQCSVMRRMVLFLLRQSLQRSMVQRRIIMALSVQKKRNSKKKKTDRRWGPARQRNWNVPINKVVARCGAASDVDARPIHLIYRRWEEESPLWNRLAEANTTSQSPSDSSKAFIRSCSTQNGPSHHNSYGRIPHACDSFCRNACVSHVRFPSSCLLQGKGYSPDKRGGE